MPKGGAADLSKLSVSRETMSDLSLFVELLGLWNARLNLVSAGSLPDVWERHVLDSMQLLALFPIIFGRYVDVGAGAGFPGIVLAICLKHGCPDVETVLVESDRRKAEFLRNVVRRLALKVDVICARIEETVPLEADVLTARAVAPLPVLLEACRMHLRAGGRALFPKGASWREEVASARDLCRFCMAVHPSATHGEAAVLEIWNVSYA